MTRLSPTLLTAVLCAVIAPAMARSQEPTGQAWGLLIGVEQYEKAVPLQFTVNDVRQIAETLQQYGGVREQNLLLLTDEAKSEQHKPYRKSLETAIPEFLKQPGPEDSIIIFFSGHGFKDPQGRLYLAPLDCDPANPLATGVSAEWFRGQLEACPAKFKLLVIDACHAGAEKGDEADSAAAKELGELFKESVGVITLASSTGDEKSQLWPFKQQSLFSYWLNQGLRGHADLDADGAVDVDELYQFVHARVRQTAEVRLGRPQTPVRIVGPRVPGVPAILRLHPQPLKKILADMSDQIAGLMEERQIASLGVLEFTNESLLGETLGSEFGLLGKYCSDQLERGLLARSAGRFSVMDRARMQGALRAQQFSLESFESADAIKSLSTSLNDLPVIVRGTLFDRAGHTINLRCRILETRENTTIGYVGGIAKLSESEWAMVGRSVHIALEDRQPTISAGDSGPQNVEQQVIERADEQAQGPHPLSNPAFPYRVKMMIRNGDRLQERAPVFRENECYLPVQMGEIYELYVENLSGQKVLLRLLVDGLNTGLERETDEKGLETYVVGKRVSLDEARFWVLDPQDPLARRVPGGAQWAIRGFITQTGVRGKYREFVIVDAQSSLAARRQFTDQMGLITAAFYMPKEPRGVGTGLGAERDDAVREGAKIQAGNLLAVVHLKYVEAEALRSAQPQ